jgi:zeaxanthin glucosyltransferase
MSRVLFSTFFDAGHIFPTFQIAKKLLARGHDVAYIGIEDAEEMVVREGLRFIPIFSDLMPRGYWPDRSARRAHRRGLALVQEWRRGTAVARRAIEEVFAGKVDATLRRAAPDLVVFDNLLPWLGLHVQGLGMRPLQLNTNVPWRKEGLSPPFSSPHIPRDDLRTRALNALHHARARGFLTLLSVLGAAVDVFSVVRRFARKVGYPTEQIESGSGFPIVRFPELVLCPREFVEMGFPLCRGDYHFVEPSIDRTRAQPEFPWERLHPEAPLIFASFGSVNWLAKSRHRFFRLFDEVMLQRPQWQAVAAVGSHLQPVEFRAPNLVCVPFAPQLRLLERARVAVVHGGFNSVKECVYYGVPMVVFPSHSDQPSNAARVVHHRLGLRGDPNTITAAQLLEQLDRLIDDPSYRQRAAEMSSIFRKAEERSPSVEVIEDLLARPAGAPTWRPVARRN